MNAPLDLGGGGGGGDTLQLMVGGGQGEPELLLLIERPNDGMVRVRSWTSDDWGATPAESQRRVIDLLRDIEGWAKQRRGLNHQISVVRRWLGMPG